MVGQRDVGFMNIIVYQSAPPGSGRCLGEVVKGIVSEERTEMYSAISGLADRLRRARYDVALAVLSAVNKAELVEIVSLGDLLRGIRIILVLPDREQDTISKAHTLYPRYLSYLDGDFEDVAAVLKKMMKLVRSG